MQNRFDEALDAKEAAILKLDVRLRNQCYTRARSFYTTMEETMLRTSVPFVWAPDITRAVAQSSISIPHDAVLDTSWLHAETGWWWLGAQTPLIGRCLRTLDSAHGVSHQRPLHAIAYQHWPASNAVAIAALTTTHGEELPGPITIAGMEWRVGQSLDEAVAEMKAMQSRVAEIAAEENAAHIANVGVVDVVDPTTWAAYWTLTCITTLHFFAAASLWLNQRILVAEPAQASRGARRRAEKAGLSSDLHIVRLRRAEHAREAEAAEASTADGREYSCQWVVRGHWRNQFYSTTKTHRPIWIDPYTKGPDDKPLKTSSTLFTVDR